MKTKTAVLNGKPDAGNPHVRFDEGEVASAKPRRGSLLYKNQASRVVRRAVFAAAVVMVGVMAQAKVLVYDGFYCDPHDSTAYTTATVQGSPRAHVIGFEG